MLSTKECLKFTAIVSAGMMTGTALYISLVEVRSRRNLPIKAMREQWSESFNGAATFVICVGAIQTLSTVTLYFLDTSPVRNFWLVDPAIFIFGGIYTTFVMLPEIKELKTDDTVAKKGEKWVEEAIGRWANRHLFRTVFNTVGFGMVIYTALKSQ